MASQIRVLSDLAGSIRVLSDLASQILVLLDLVVQILVFNLARQFRVMSLWPVRFAFCRIWSVSFAC
jgi:hypothetical protein